MTWDCRLSKEAVKQLRRLPRDRQQQVGRALDEKTVDPLSGDVRPLKGGRLKGMLCKRIGRYRIVFSVDQTSRVVEIAAILIRDEQTYRP